MLRLPLNQTQHFEVFKLSKFFVLFIKIKVININIKNFKKKFTHISFFEKYILDININKFKIRVIKFAINIGVDEIL